MKKRILAFALALCMIGSLIPSVFAVTVTSKTAYFGNHTYQFIGSSASWKDAKEQCEELGGHLLTITSQEEQAFITSFLYSIYNESNSRGGSWLGLIRENGISRWITGETFEYSNWNTGEPNGGNSTGYGIVNRNGKWNDGGNTWSDSSGFICEWDEYNMVTIVSPSNGEIVFKDFLMSFEIRGKYLLGDGTLLIKDFTTDEVLSTISAEKIGDIYYDEASDCTEVSIYITEMPFNKKIYPAIDGNLFYNADTREVLHNFPSKEEWSLQTTKDAWSFENYKSKNDYLLYSELYSPIVAACLWATDSNNNNDEHKGGLCFGMSATAMTFDQGYISYSDFDQENTKRVYDLTKESYSSDLNRSAEGYIKLAYISQFSSYFQSKRKNNRMDMAGLVDAVEAYEKSGKNPVMLCLEGSEGNHAVWAYATEVHDTYCDILVYDCIQPSQIVKIRLVGQYPNFSLESEKYDSISFITDCDIVYFIAKELSTDTLNPEYMDIIQDDSYNLMTTDAEMFNAIGVDGNVISSLDVYGEQDIIVPITAMDDDGNTIEAEKKFWIKNTSSIVLENREEKVNSVNYAGTRSGLQIDVSSTSSVNITSDEQGILWARLNADNQQSLKTFYSCVIDEDKIFNVSIEGTITEITTIKGKENGVSILGIDMPSISAYYDGTEVTRYLEIDTDTLFSVELEQREDNTYVVISYGDGKYETPIGEAAVEATYTITFNANGGTVGADTMTTGADGKLESLPTSTRNGYTFDGWYTAVDGGTEITTDTVFTADTTVYAHWTKDSTFPAVPANPTKPETGSDDSEPEDTRDTFRDVSEDDYFADAVEWAVESGITTGTGSRTFSPDAVCTRAQAVAFLWRAAGSPAPMSNVNPFADVKAGAYYYDAVLWAVEQGIVKGTSETTFSPEETVTRAQAVTFLWRSAGSPAVEADNPFADVSGSAYYADAVEWAVENGITTGTAPAAFSPNLGCTRAQIVTFLYRCFAK